MDHAELGRLVATFLERMGSVVLWLLREGVPVLIALAIRDVLANRAAAADKAEVVPSGEEAADGE